MNQSMYQTVSLRVSCEISTELHNHQPVFRDTFTDSSVKFNPFVELNLLVMKYQQITHFVNYMYLKDTSVHTSF